MTAITDRRRDVLASHAAVMATYTDVAPTDDALAEALFWTGERLRQEYLDLLPLVAVSRCPHTGEVLEILIDDQDLDGLWWSYEAPLRLVGERPPSLLALSGALRPSGALPLGVAPGPTSPYVLPRMLADDRVVAVISQLEIGQHTGWPIAYFSSDPDATLLRANEWGTPGFTRIGSDGAIEHGAWPESDDDRDHDLAPWIERGRLRWIAPGDASLEVRIGADGCPFLGVGR